MSERITSILAEYNEHTGLYDDFRRKVEYLLTEVLRTSGIRISAVSSRLKERSSFERKIRGSKKYTVARSVTDVAGARVVTFFEDDVDQVDEIIRANFDIDIVNSVDKRQTLRTDQFGYQSLHLVASLNNRRLSQSELQQFAGLKIEIQVRSLLQHTWAEIEYRLGYKPESRVPASIKRRFSRLAGLLELADEEFVAVREDSGALTNDLPICRAEGITELVPPFSIDIACSELLADSALVQEPLILYVNTHVTNRLFPDKGTEVWLQVLEGSARSDTARGVLDASNGVAFFHVLPMFPPQKSEFIRIRISGLRVDASYLGPGSDTAPAMIQGRLSLGRRKMNADQPWLTDNIDIARPRPSFRFEAAELGRTDLLPWPRKAEILTEFGIRVTYQALIPKAFRTSKEERLGGQMTARGTRLALQLYNVPVGGRVFVTVGELAGAATQVCFRLTNVDLLGEGDFRPVTSTFSGTLDGVKADFVELIVYGGALTVAWECTGFVHDNQVASFGVLIAVPVNTKLDTMSVSGSFAPFSTSTLASSTGSVPRFAYNHHDPIRIFERTSG